MDPKIPSFVKKFDFRGVYEKDLNDKDAYYLALALKVTYNPKKIILAWDTRVSSRSLAENFMQALKDTEIEISYLEKVPIDYLTVAANALEFDLSIMFTGSHNPWDWTGLLMHTRGGASIHGEDVERIIQEYYLAKKEEYNKPEIDLAHYQNVEKEVEQIYADRLATLLPLNEISDLRILVDVGDGSTGKALDTLILLLPQVTFDRLNDRGIYDQNTPHIADPSEIKNMQQLASAVVRDGYNCGFAFDSDGDRVLAVDENGKYINGSTLASALVTVFYSLGIATEKIGYAVECGPSLYNTVVDINKSAQEKINIEPIAVGRSRVRDLLFEGKIDVGVENVGHFYIKDFFKTDSAIFNLTTTLYWMSLNGKLSKLLTNHPDGDRTQGSWEQNSANEKKSEKILNDVKNTFPDTKNISVDGVRLEAYKGEYMNVWCAIRRSGYESVEKYYYGALDHENFVKLEKIFQDNATHDK